jgi:hypothetical protein
MVNSKPAAIAEDCEGIVSSAPTLAEVRQRQAEAIHAGFEHAARRRGIKF